MSRAIALSVLLFINGPRAAGASGVDWNASALADDDVCDTEDGGRACALNALQAPARLSVSANGSASPVFGLTDWTAAGNFYQAESGMTTHGGHTLQELTDIVTDLEIPENVFPRKMLSVVVVYQVNATSIDDFVHVFEELTEYVKSIVGTHLFELCSDPDPQYPGRFRSVELYTTLFPFFQAHTRLLRNLDLFRRFQALLTEPPTTKVLTVLGNPGLRNVPTTLVMVAIWNVSNLTGFESLLMPYIHGVSYEEDGNTYVAYGKSKEMTYWSVEAFETRRKLFAHRRLGFVKAFKANAAQYMYEDEPATVYLTPQGAWNAFGPTLSEAMIAEWAAANPTPPPTRRR